MLLVNRKSGKFSFIKSTTVNCDIFPHSKYCDIDPTFNFTDMFKKNRLDFLIFELILMLYIKFAP